MPANVDKLKRLSPPAGSDLLGRQVGSDGRVRPASEWPGVKFPKKQSRIR